ncbi:MAG TPA: TonB family protein [Abditibacterium sp.]|jgi:TonB family protein
MKSALDNAPNRLGIAVLTSLGLNLVLWGAVGAALLGQKTPTVPPLEISRITLSKTGQKQPKSVSKKQIARKVERIRRQVRRRAQRIRQVKPEKVRRDRPLTAPEKTEKARPNAPLSPNARRAPSRPAPPANGARNRILTSQNSENSSTHFAKPGGKADLGRPLNSQNFGEQKDNPQNLTAPIPEPQPTAVPEAPSSSIPPAPEPEPTNTPRPEPTPTPKPEPTPTPRPEPTATPVPTNTPRPVPTPTPRPQGPTRGAIAVRTAQPSIPEELRGGQFRTSVRVRVEIGADGSSSPSLRGSSGSSEIDSRVLAALRRWKWKPALKDGEPVASSQNFRFDFEVR